MTFAALWRWIARVFIIGAVIGLSLGIGASIIETALATINPSKTEKKR